MVQKSIESYFAELYFKEHKIEKRMYSMQMRNGEHPELILRYVASGKIRPPVTVHIPLEKVWDLLAKHILNLEEHLLDC